MKRGPDVATREYIQCCQVPRTPKELSEYLGVTLERAKESARILTDIGILKCLEDGRYTNAD